MAVKINVDTIELQHMIYQLGERAPRVAAEIVQGTGEMLVEAMKEEITNNERLSDRQKRLFISNLDTKTQTLKWGARGEAGILFKEYNAADPNAGVLGIWAEYGTEERFTKLARYRGYLSPAYFTRNARKKIARKVREYQINTVEKELFRNG